MLVNLKCPNCGAPTQIDERRQFIFCQFCGTKIVNMPQRYEYNINQNINQNVVHSGTVTHRMDRSGQPNLYINFGSSKQEVGMVVKIKTTKEKSHFVNGQTLTYHLAPGEHAIALKIGKINYNRKIFIPPNNMPVRIYASWNGRAHITIDQP